MSRHAPCQHAAPATRTLRVFYAIELDAEARRAARDVSRALSEGPDGDALRWVRAENFHVTLRFVGDVSADCVPALMRGVRAELSAYAPFRIALGGVCALPPRGALRVVALDLAQPEPLCQLAIAVERGVVVAGFSPSSRPFRPHLTLGRARRGRRAPSLHGAPRPAASPFAVREVVLFRSRLSATGAVYTPLERIVLEDPIHPSARAASGPS